MLRVITNMDPETGEVFRNKKEYIEDTFNGEGYRVPAHKRGAKMFADVQFPEEMTDAEIGKVARLAKLMVSTSNMLGYRTAGGIVPYSEQHLAKLAGLKSWRGKDFIAKMIRLGVMQKTKRVIGEDESEEFYINPAYFFAGRRISLNLYLLFREHLDPILPDWVKHEFWQAAKEQAQPDD